MSRVIGFWGATALVAGNMIGSGVLLVPVDLAPYGGLAFLGWIVTTVGALCLAVSFAHLSQYVPNVGGPYTYVNHAFGKFTGFQVAWMYWIFSWSSNATLVVAALSYLSIFWPEVMQNKLLFLSIEMILVWGFTILNIFGVKVASVAQILITTLKISPIAFFGLLGLSLLKVDALFSPPLIEVSGFSAINSTISLTLWAFIGLESATIPADSVKNPTKTIPRATICGVLIAAFLYIFGTLVLMGVVPLEFLKNSKAPYVDATNVLFGPIAGWAMAIIGFIAISGTLNGWLLIQGQAPFAMAKEGLFPKIFTKTTSKDVPVYGLIIGSVLMSLLLLLVCNQPFNKQFSLLALFSTLTIIIPYLYSSVASVILDKHKKPGNIIASTVGFLYGFWALVSSPVEIILAGFILLLISAPLYMFINKSE